VLIAGILDDEVGMGSSKENKSTSGAFFLGGASTFLEVDFSVPARLLDAEDVDASVCLRPCDEPVPSSYSSYSSNLSARLPVSLPLSLPVS